MIALGYSTRGLARQILTRARNAVLEKVVSRALCVIGLHRWHCVSAPRWRCVECGKREVRP